MLTRDLRDVARQIGDEIDVEPISTNPGCGFIDFARVGRPTPSPPGKR